MTTGVGRIVQRKSCQANLGVGPEPSRCYEKVGMAQAVGTLQARLPLTQPTPTQETTPCALDNKTRQFSRSRGAVPTCPEQADLILAGPGRTCGTLGRRHGTFSTIGDAADELCASITLRPAEVSSKLV